MNRTQVNSVATNCGDPITVLVTAESRRATKRFSMQGGKPQKEDYDAGFLFGVLPDYKMKNIQQLSECLSALEAMPNAFVIRGVPRSGLDTSSHVQRRNENFESPVAGHHWVLIDLDKIKLPKRLSLKKSIPDVIEYLVQMLPGEFHDVSCHWQLSSSAGMGAIDTVSMHLWFWLESPATDEALKIWAKSVNETTGKKLIDPALFQAVQIHYTAAPLFVGLSDPFPTRSGLTTKAKDAVALVLSRPASPSTPAKNLSRAATTNSPSLSTNQTVTRGFENILATIGDHPGGGGFHEPITRAAASYVATHGTAATDVEFLRETLSAAVLAADSRAHDPNYVEQKAGRDDIMHAIQTAIVKYGNQPSSSPRLHEGLEPHFKTKRVSAREASQRLARILK